VRRLIRVNFRSGLDVEGRYREWTLMILVKWWVVVGGAFRSAIIIKGEVLRCELYLNENGKKYR